MEQLTPAANEDDIHHVHNTLCPSCSGPNAHTKILPTNIPYFRQIIILSVDCPDCHFRDAQVDFGSVQSKGERITLVVKNNNRTEVMNRQVVKSDSATVSIPSLDLELPPKTQVGVNTLEGMLSRAANNLESLQEDRLRMGDVDNFHRCRGVISKLRSILGGDNHDDDIDTCENGDDADESGGNKCMPFTIIIDDPAGNSFIENPHAPNPDPNLTHEKYNRTPTQDISLGLQPSAMVRANGDSFKAQQHIANGSSSQHHPFEIEEDRLESQTGSSTHGEAMKFATDCPHCHASAETSMCVTNIPHFKEVIIMCLLCEQCGYKSNEIKGGGAIPDFGTNITLHVRDMRDLKREVLKSDTAGISVPELELGLEEGGLDGVYTTVEGLMMKIHDKLRDANPFGTGDSSVRHHAGNDGERFSAPRAEHVKYMDFLGRLKGMAMGQQFPFTVIITDPLSNSFVGTLPEVAEAMSLQVEKETTMNCCNAVNDDGLEVEEYKRTEDQNESLGLNDVRTENY